MNKYTPTFWNIVFYTGLLMVATTFAVALFSVDESGAWLPGVHSEWIVLATIFAMIMTCIGAIGKTVGR